MVHDTEARVATPETPHWRALILRRHLVFLPVLAFASGLPISLCGSTLQGWLSTIDEIELTTIGWFTVLTWPYLLKFLWAPLMDRYIPPILGRRRGWILIMQLALVGAIAALGVQDPTQHLYLVAFLAFSIAVLSASQDIAADAYRTDVLSPMERGFGSGLWVGSYRVAMVVSGPLALILMDQYGAHAAYLAMAALLLLAGMGTIAAPEPSAPFAQPARIWSAIVEPIVQLVTRRGAVLLLVFVLVYKLGDALALSLMTTFLVRGLHFTLTEVGAISKNLSIIATIVGALCGGAMVFRFGLFRTLLWFGIGQAVTNLGFVWLAVIEKSYLAMAVVYACDQFIGGMGTAAFMAFLMALCDSRFSAFQFALLSALSAIGRVLGGPLAANLADTHGWSSFFFVTFLIAVPGLILAVALKPRIVPLDAESVRAHA
jgi:PAT family beta-lactamase induction signal transducer AmpG